MQKKPSFTMGIEEEFMLVDQETYELMDGSKEFFEECAKKTQGRATTEYLRCQIEVATGVCTTIGHARDELRELRSTVAGVAERHGLAPIAVSTHPMASWKDQHRSEKTRYEDLQRKFGDVADRMLISGMHVHIGVPSKSDRIEIINQMKYFLPHLLALSTSSPYWQGKDTGLNSYRLTVLDNLPRSGLPPSFGSWGDYKRYVKTLTSFDLVDNSSKIWWDQRPSSRYPTLETRIFDIPARLEDTLTLAALSQCLTRMIWSLAEENRSWRIHEDMLISENRWTAQRDGIGAELVDYGENKIKPLEVLATEFITLLEEHASALGCSREMERVWEIVTQGNSASRQRDIVRDRASRGLDMQDAFRLVVQDLINQFHVDL